MTIAGSVCRHLRTNQQALRASCAAVQSLQEGCVFWPQSTKQLCNAPRAAIATYPNKLLQLL
jgi:hypothetical protein